MTLPKSHMILLLQYDTYLNEPIKQLHKIINDDDDDDDGRYTDQQEQILWN